MLRPLIRIALLLLCVAGWSISAFSVAVDRPLEDPAQEARARAIHKQLRCLVCQNQSIEDSNATLARDLRILVRDRITLGDSDQAAIRYIVERYGDWVLLKPPVKAATILLWAGPAVILLLAIVLIALWYRRRGGPIGRTVEPLSIDEQNRLKDLLGDGDRS
ncbi:MAG: cytochrome c-type biogenesis protein [Alphaproteobacteria bacterium]|jgi:cytochrome c-type biogenesis protein CcmH